MPTLSRRQLALLVLLTLTWGLNWPIMKFGVTGYPPLTFRTLSIWLGVPVLAVAMVVLKVPFRIAPGPRGERWWALLGLSVTNMFIWHICIILAVQWLSSGRSAILGYTMPIFSALIGAWFYQHCLTARGWLGVGAAALGVLLLLWNEFTALTGKPLGVALALFAAAAWALGTQQLRHTRLTEPTLTLSFWMTVLTALVLTALAWLFERGDTGVWPQVSGLRTATLLAILYNGVLVFGFAQATWFVLARGLPPIASTLSVMLIPVLGVFTGAWLLHEHLSWQDWSAVVLMVVSIATVLWPSRAPARS